MASPDFLLEDAPNDGKLDLVLTRTCWISSSSFSKMLILYTYDGRDPISSAIFAVDFAMSSAA